MIAAARNKQAAVAPDVSLIDNHVHLFSQHTAAWLERALGKRISPFTVDDLDPVLRSDGVDHAVILSAAYLLGCPVGPTAPDAASIERENDWIAEQVSRHPKRLTGFCSVNPLMASSGAEIVRCARTRAFAGVKLHLTNSAVDLRRGDDLDRLEVTFQAAAEHGLAVVVHLRTRTPDFGAEDAERFIVACLEGAPTVPVQVAHVGGWGGYDPATDAALGAFEDWLSASRRAAPVVFDLSAVVREVHGATPTDDAKWFPDQRYDRLVERLRRIGLDRLLFGSDWPDWQPRSYEADIRSHTPLTAGEVTALAARAAPWLAAQVGHRVDP